jgi:hypothetical protein
MFKQNKYLRCYYNIINRALSRETTGYAETHHIIPRSLGGTDHKDNLVKLTAREHFICHLLLPKITEGAAYQKMIYAYTIMSGRKIYGARKYEFYRKEYAEINSILRSGEGNGMFGVDRSGDKNTFFGKKHTQETKDLISKKKTCVSIKQPPFTDEHRRNISNARKKMGESHSFIHPVHGLFHGTIPALCEKYSGTFNKPYHKAELWKLANGLYKSCKGWTSPLTTP